MITALALAFILPPLASASVARRCGPSSAKVVCVDKYASVLPYPFQRAVSNGKDIGLDQFSQTNTTDKSFDEVSSADFIVFDKKALQLLGGTPKAEKMFTIPKLVHEAPVYVPDQEKIYFSQPAVPGFLKQFVIDLKANPPKLSEFESNPPVYSPNGGTICNGTIIWAQSGGNASLIDSNGKIFEARQGIVTMDPKTGKATTILNNFFGRFFNQVNDLVVDKKGDIWFTDPQYAWFSDLSIVAPTLPPATYRFRPSTGAVSLVEDTCLQPNGILLSPDEKTLYIADSGSITGNTAANAKGAGTNFDTKRGGHTIYAFDVLNGRNLVNKRPVYTSPDWIPDGIKAAKNGLIVTGAGMGVDVIDPEEGVIVMRIQTDYPVMNIVFAGQDRKELWVVGAGGVTRVKWALEGVELK